MATQANRKPTPANDMPLVERDFDLSALMREYGIRTIWRDPALDRFHVVLLDYSDGQGGGVGEALADAQRRAA